MLCPAKRPVADAVSRPPHVEAHVTDLINAIMAVFGMPAALEDHAVRACLAALGVQEEAKRRAVGVPQ
jgi:hypothetical protein